MDVYFLSPKRQRTFKDIFYLVQLRIKSVLLVLLLKSNRLLLMFSQFFSNVRKERISVRNNGDKLVAVRYTRSSLKMRPTFILNIGISSYSDNHVVLNHLAKAIAMLGYHVLIPGFYEMKDCWLRKESVENIGQAVCAISNLSYVDSKHIAVVGVSFSGGMSIIAATTPNVHKNTKLLVAFGTYADIQSALRFSFTGRFKVNGKVKKIVPNPWGRIVFLHNFLENIRKTLNAEKIRKVLGNLIKDREDWAFSDIRHLDPSDRAIVLSAYRDYGRKSKEWLEQLTPKIRELSESLSPVNVRGDLKIPIFLIHGIHDDMIDYGQSVQLSRSLNSSGGVYLHLSDLLHHKDATSFLFNPGKWIIGAAQLSNVFYKILSTLHTK